jgi:hypothetical protein
MVWWLKGCCARQCRAGKRYEIFARFEILFLVVLRLCLHLLSPPPPLPCRDSKSALTPPLDGLGYSGMRDV